MSRTVRAPRGTTLTAKGWPQEAALRMLQNNLDPEVAEHPRGARRLRRLGQGRTRLAVVRRAGQDADDAGGRRDAPGAVRPARGRLPHPRVGAPGAHRQLQPGARLGQLGGVPAAGGGRADHVRADDRGLLDLHRHPGHPAGHVRDVRGGGGPAFRRLAGRHDHADGRARRDGRRPAAGRHHERRRRHLRRLRPALGHPPDRAPLPRRPGVLPGGGAAPGLRGA